MTIDFNLEVIEIFRLSVGYNCFICTIDPGKHQLIPSGTNAKVVVEDMFEKKLSAVGENLFRSGKMYDENKTVLVTKDNVDDIVKFVGKKKIFIKGSFSVNGSLDNRVY